MTSSGSGSVATRTATSRSTTWASPGSTARSSAGRASLQLRDLQSGNGTFVNGRQIQTHNLNDGDLISLGKCSIRFENLDRTTAPGNLADVPVSDGLGMMTLQVDAAKLARKQRERMQQTKGYLSSPGRKDVVLDGALTLVGKDPDAQVHVDGWFCPRMIAVIVRDESGFRITDVSPGGRSLTINRVVKKSAPLGEDDVVTIRGVEFTFHNGLPVGAHA